jgi:hypothetical protein
MEIQSSAGGQTIRTLWPHERLRCPYGEKVFDHLGPPMRRFLARQGMGRRDCRHGVRTT